MQPNRPSGGGGRLRAANSPKRCARIVSTDTTIGGLSDACAVQRFASALSANWHLPFGSMPTPPVDGPGLRTSRHFALPAVEGGEDFALLAFGHLEVVKGAAKFRFDFVEHLGCDLLTGPTRAPLALVAKTMRARALLVASRASFQLSAKTRRARTWGTTNTAWRSTSARTTPQPATESHNPMTAAVFPRSRRTLALARFT
jgi:hypothetical protein